MKTLILAVLLMFSAIVTASAVPVGALPAFGPVTFRFSSVGQNASFQLVSSKTNATPSSTNIVSTYNSSVTNFTVNNDHMLKLLENSYNTNFPSGARLYVSGTSFYVMDFTGSNILLNVSSVLSLHLHPHVVHAGVETVSITQENGGTTYAGKDAELYTEYYDLNYDDSGFATADGTQTSFQISGLMSIKSLFDVGTGTTRSSFNFNGQGEGTIHDAWKLFKGTLIGSGVTQAPI